jgi:CubicO group peptidase (beta-lactamase class C family)
MSRFGKCVVALIVVVMLGSSGIAFASRVGGSCTKAGTKATITVKGKRTQVVCTQVKNQLIWVAVAAKTMEVASVGPNPKYELLAAAVAANEGSCMVAQESGKIVGEWYWNGRTPTTLSEGFSTMKSMAATLIGIAQTQGKLNINQKASDFITEWKGTPSESITIKQILSNNSGRAYDNADIVTLALKSDVEPYVLNRGQEAPPGTTWEYNNTAIQAIETILERAIKGSVETFAQTYLLKPLGMKSELTADSAGNVYAFAFWQTSCRDLSKLAQLYLQNGKWNGVQLVSEAFIREALTSSTELNAAYGYLWWLNRAGNWMTPGNTKKLSGPPHKSAPLDIFWASGACGQIAAGFPSQNLVITYMRTKTIFDFLLCSSDSQANALNGLVDKILAKIK